MKKSCDQMIMSSQPLLFAAAKEPSPIIAIIFSVAAGTKKVHQVNCENAGS